MSLCFLRIWKAEGRRWQAWKQSGCLTRPSTRAKQTGTIKKIFIVFRLRVKEFVSWHQGHVRDIANSDFPYSLKKDVFIPHLSGGYLKVFCIKTASVRCSFTVVCNSYRAFLLSLDTPFFEREIEFCSPENFILGCRRAVARQGV